jgi:hypothetical protein
MSVADQYRIIAAGAGWIDRLTADGFDSGPRRSVVSARARVE